MTFEDALEIAEQKHSDQFDGWSFDERDEPEYFDEYIEEILKRKILDEEKTSNVYLAAKKRCDELTDAAEDVARQGRLGDRMSSAKAETLFYQLKM
jgi:hypothetical protein